MTFNCSESPLTVAYFISDSRMDLLLGLYIMLTTVSVVFLGVFCLAKSQNQYERLRVRPTSIVALAAVATFMHAQVGPGFYALGREHFPCWLRSLLTMQVLPFMYANQLLRLMTFYFMSLLNREMTKVDRMGEDLFQATEQNVFQALSNLLVVSTCTVSPNRVIVALSFITSRRGISAVTVLFCACSLVVALLIMSSRPETINGCMGCFLSMGEVVEIMVVAVFLLVCLSVYTYKSWAFPDPWGLRREVFLCVLSSMLIILGFLAGIYLDALGDESTYDHQVLLCMGFLLLLGVQSIWQVLLTRKQPAVPKRYTIEVNNSSSTQGGGGGGERPLTLEQIMKTPELLKLFEDFLIAELGVESLMFIKDTDDWKRAYFTIAPNARVVRAKRLFNLYLSTNAKFEINVSSHCSKQVKDVFSKLDSELQLSLGDDVFDLPREEIVDLLQLGALRRFRFIQSYKTPPSSNLGLAVKA
ncbi:hypothetical protein BASA81_008805 [Batrachochytrium salamandrivorans]|nr:hypothetical protein BASA81_008805 [Batrachochytrium salamandrivorans]